MPVFDPSIAHFLIAKCVLIVRSVCPPSIIKIIHPKLDKICNPYLWVSDRTALAEIVCISTKFLTALLCIPGQNKPCPMPKNDFAKFENSSLPNVDFR